MNPVLREVAEKKSKILSKILKIDSKSLETRRSSSSSGPDTIVIEKMQDRINNPLFELSIADYELMCGNKKLLKMTSTVLECEERQLKKFCKYINVFKENINSSPESIKNKMKSTMSLNNLPYDLKTQIVEKYKLLFPIKYVLRSWIPEDKINWDILSGNPNSVDFLRENPDKIKWNMLSGNPNAIELLEERIKIEAELDEDELYDLDITEKISWNMLAKNPNPQVITILKANPTHINWMYLSENPNAIGLLKEKIAKEKKMEESDYDDLYDIHKISWELLSENPNAIDLLKANPTKIIWERISKNPNAIKLIKKNLDNVDWVELSGNPNAIEILKANRDEIDWSMLSENQNPKAITLLKANPDKIDWSELSGNPSAIKLLKANPAKIDWASLSGNKEAIELLKANPTKIDWNILSRNPNPKAIELFKENLDKIDFYFISANPAIFEAV